MPDQTVPSMGSASDACREIERVSTMEEIAGVLRDFYARGNFGTLVKIEINPASEVVRLTEDDHLMAEAELLNRMADIICRAFAESGIYQMAFNAFLIVLEGGFDANKTALHEFISANVSRQMRFGNHVYFPKIFVGITELEGHFGLTLSRLDFATRTASVSADHTSCYVSCGDERFATYRKLRMGLHDLRQALDGSEFGLFAQPIVALDDEHASPRKFEILLRHYRDVQTVEPPGDMLQIANFNDVTQDVDLYVMELLCRNYHNLFGPDGGRIDTVTVNISGPSFVRPRFAETLIDVAARYGVPSSKLVLEVTEDVANSVKDDAIATMLKFREAGFRLALDDIGTGSSNFRTLDDFPVDFYKIDRSFCEEVRSNPCVRAFVQLIIDIGKANGKKVIAEGIPDEETRQFLRSMGADFSQSFLTGGPRKLVPAPGFALKR